MFCSNERCQSLPNLHAQGFTGPGKHQVGDLSGSCEDASRSLESAALFQNGLIKRRRADGKKKLRRPSSFAARVHGDPPQQPHNADQFAEGIEPRSEVGKIGRKPLSQRCSFFRDPQPDRPRLLIATSGIAQDLFHPGIVVEQVAKLQGSVRHILRILPGSRLIQKLSLPEHTFCHPKKLQQQCRKRLALQSVAPDRFGNPRLVAILRSVVGFRVF